MTSLSASCNTQRGELQTIAATTTAGKPYNSVHRPRLKTSLRARGLHSIAFRNGYVQCTSKTVKFAIRTGHEGPNREQSCSSTLSLTSTLVVVGTKATPGRFTPREGTRYPLPRRLGGPQGRCGRVLKIFPPPGFDSRTVHPYVQCPAR